MGIKVKFIYSGLLRLVTGKKEESFLLSKEDATVDDAIELLVRVYGEEIRHKINSGVHILLKKNNEEFKNINYLERYKTRLGHNSILMFNYPFSGG